MAGTLTTRNNFWLLVLTADELRLFAMGHGTGWHGRCRDVLDTELICVPLNAVERVEHRRSINPMFKGCRLIFTDGDQMTLQALGGVNNGAEVIERLTDLLAGGARRGPAEGPMVARHLMPSLWRSVAGVVGLCLFVFLSLLITRIITEL